jgi:adenosylcobinamide hydrolase
MSDVTIRSEVCRLSIPNGRWLGTGVNGGIRVADGAVNVSVPSDFDRQDLDDVVAERCAAAGFAGDGPALLTAVEQHHARGARAGSVAVVATAGLSNPATLPIKPSKEESGSGDDRDRPPIGTVNLLVATDLALSAAGLAGALASAVEAKTATLQAMTGFTGTTSDAVAVGSNREGEDITFVGSSTDVGQAIRACVRDALCASLESTYADQELPTSVGEAEHGAITECETTVFAP